MVGFDFIAASIICGAFGGLSSHLQHLYGISSKLAISDNKDFKLARSIRIKLLSCSCMLGASIGFFAATGFLGFYGVADSLVETELLCFSIAFFAALLREDFIELFKKTVY